MVLGACDDVVVRLRVPWKFSTASSGLSTATGGETSTSEPARVQLAGCQAHHRSLGKSSNVFINIKSDLIIRTYSENDRAHSTQLNLYYLMPSRELSDGVEFSEVPDPNLVTSCREKTVARWRQGNVINSCLAWNESRLYKAHIFSPLVQQAPGFLMSSFLDYGPPGPFLPSNPWIRSRTSTHWINSIVHHWMQMDFQNPWVCKNYYLAHARV